MHADVAITIIFGGFVALTALVTGIALLRARLAARVGEERAEQQPAGRVH